MTIVWLAGAALVVVVAQGIRESRARARRRVCPVCDGRALKLEDWVRWSGIGPTGERTGGARSNWRCTSCGEALFEELGSFPMTAADHARWLELRPDQRAKFPRAHVHTPKD